MKNTSKSSRNDRNRQASVGVQKHITSAIVLGGVSYAPATMVSVLTDPVAKASATATALGAYHEAVVEEQASVKAADVLYEELRKEALNLFKGQPTVLADFGITVPAPKVRTAEQKAAAAAKAKATRAAKKAALAAVAAPVAALTTTKS